MLSIDICNLHSGAGNQAPKVQRRFHRQRIRARLSQSYFDISTPPRLRSYKKGDGSSYWVTKRTWHRTRFSRTISSSSPNGCIALNLVTTINLKDFALLPNIYVNRCGLNSYIHICHRQLLLLLPLVRWTQPPMNLLRYDLFKLSSVNLEWSYVRTWSQHVLPLCFRAFAAPRHQVQLRKQVCIEVLPSWKLRRVCWLPSSFVSTWSLIDNLKISSDIPLLLSTSGIYDGMKQSLGMELRCLIRIMCKHCSEKELWVHGT